MSDALILALTTLRNVEHQIAAGAVAGRLPSDQMVTFHAQVAADYAGELEKVRVEAARLLAVVELAS